MTNVYHDVRLIQGEFHTRGALEVSRAGLTFRPTIAQKRDEYLTYHNGNNLTSSETTDIENNTIKEGPSSWPWADFERFQIKRKLKVMRLLFLPSNNSKNNNLQQQPSQTTSPLVFQLQTGAELQQLNADAKLGIQIGSMNVNNVSQSQNENKGQQQVTTTLNDLEQASSSPNTTNNQQSVQVGIHGSGDTNTGMGADASSTASTPGHDEVLSTASQFVDEGSEGASDDEDATTEETKSEHRQLLQLNSRSSRVDMMNSARSTAFFKHSAFRSGREMRMSTLDLETNERIVAVTERHLTQDTFSFFLFVSPRNFSFWFSLVVFMSQVATFSLVLADIVDIGAPRNKFNIPPNVESTVRATQVIAILIAVFTQQDIRNAMNMLRDGYRPEYFIAFDGANLSKWLLSILLRILAGVLGLVVSFLLIMQAETVIDLLLNFTAMEFVSMLDEAAFVFIKEGYVGKPMKRTAKVVSRTSYYTDGQDRVLFKTFTILFLLAALLVPGWGLIFYRQNQGYYLCSTVFAQWGDDFLPELSTFSGVYTINNNKKHSARATYQRVVPGGLSVLGYCLSEQSWTLQILQDPEEGERDSTNDMSDREDASADPCNYVAKSSQTKTFVIESLHSLDWEVRNKEERTVPLDVFQIRCYDCVMQEEEFCGSGTCDTEEKTCRCGDAGQYGLRCEFAESCETIEVDIRTGEEGFLGDREYATNYTILDPETLQVYNRPVYVNEVLVAGTAGARNNSQFDIVMFVGRHWVVTSSGLLRDLRKEAERNSEGISSKSLAVYLKKSFHAEWSSYSVSFISEAVDVDSSTDIGTPLNLEWSVALANGNGASGIQIPDKSRSRVDATFLCALCGEKNSCKLGGFCDRETGACDCIEGSSGRLCQIPPTGNARCDEFFNTPIYNMDGGDCCIGTCVSSADYTCGKDASGYVDIGYPKCLERSQGWAAAGDVIEGTAFSKLGSSVALASGGVDILAVAVPGTKAVNLYDRVGYEWNKRGASLEGFASPIAIATASSSATNNPTTLAPVILALSDRVYICESQGCRQLGDNLPGSSSDTPDQPSLSLDGKVIATTNGVFEWSNDSWYDENGQRRLSERAVSASRQPPKGEKQQTTSAPSSSDTFTLSAAPSPTVWPSQTFIPELFNNPPSVAPSPSVWPSQNFIPESFNNPPIVAPSPSLAPSGTFIPGSLNDPPVPTTSSQVGSWLPRGAPFITDINAVSLSTDGTTYAAAILSSSRMDGPSDGYYNFRGEVTVTAYKWQARISEWVALVSNPMKFNLSRGVTESFYEVLENDYLNSFQQTALSLIADGNIMAVGLLWNYQMLQGAYVFQWNKVKGWEQRGERVGYLVGWSVKLSGDGKQLVIGTGPLDGQDSAVEVHSWDGNGWRQKGRGVAGGSESSISLSGNLLAVGHPFSTLDDVGSAQVFKFPANSTAAECPEGFSQLRISLTTDSHGDETRWDLWNRNSDEVLLQGGRYTGYAFTSFVDEACVPTDDCLVFRIYDARGSGLASPGGYHLLLDGEEVAHGGNFTWYDRVTIGDCSCPRESSLFQMDFRSDHPAYTLEWEVTATKVSGGPYIHPDNFFGYDGRDIDQFYYVIQEEACLLISQCDTFNVRPYFSPAYLELYGNSNDDDFSESGCVIPNANPSKLVYSIYVNQDLLQTVDIDPANPGSLFCPSTVTLGNCSSSTDEGINIFLSQIECDDPSTCGPEGEKPTQDSDCGPEGCKLPRDDNKPPK